MSGVMFLLSLFTVTNVDAAAGSDQFFSWQFLQVVGSNVGPGLGPGLVALATSVVLTAAAIWISRRIGFVSNGGRDRDIHTRPIPFGGGIAMFGAFAVATLLFHRNDLSVSVPGLLILCGATAALFVADDRWGINAFVKLGIQVAIAVVAV